MTIKRLSDFSSMISPALQRGVKLSFARRTFEGSYRIVTCGGGARFGDKEPNTKSSYAYQKVSPYQSIAMVNLTSFYDTEFKIMNNPFHFLWHDLTTTILIHSSSVLQICGHAGLEWWLAAWRRAAIVSTSVHIRDSTYSEETFPRDVAL